MTEEEQKRFVRWGVLTVIITFILVIIPNLVLLESFFSGLNPETASLFPNIGVVLSVFYVTAFLPASVISEFGRSRILNRSFRLRNILVFWVIFGEFCLIGVASLSLFNVFFSNTSVWVQTPLLSIGLSISILVTVATLKVKRFRNYLKQAFS